MMANGIPLDTAAIVSTVLEGILYGLSVLMFIGTIWALMYRRMHCGVGIKQMVTVACLLLLFSTVHIIIDIIRTHEGLVQYREASQFDGPIGFFSDVAQWSFIYKNMIYMLQTLLGDGVVIYRCYAVWQSWWITIVSIVLWTSVAVTGVGCVYFDSKATVDRENIFAPSTGPWITAFLAATLFTNIISTSLLAFRIWKVGKRVRMSSHASVLWPVLRVVLDAGVLYSVSLLAALLCFVAKNRGHYVLIDMIMPIISITFYMVIIRITITKSNSQDAVQATTSGSGPLTLSRMSRLAGEREYPMKRMEVHMTQLTEMNERRYGSGSRTGTGTGETRGDPEKEEDGDGDDLARKVLGGFSV
ncbi:hypothetical protein OG21DRAFT_1513063 [Imleria badia]|nr:hypothetical protein OG21DRAFT_1513063 [Imleria badia]